MTDTAIAKTTRGQLPAQVTESLAQAMPNAYKLLPGDVAIERFRAAVYLHLQQSPKVLECDPATLLDCCIRAASDGLLPGLECYFLPFKGKASYVRHYQGLIKLLERTGKVRRAFAHPVYEGDTFELDYFADRYSHVPALVKRQAPGTLLYYYGALITTDGVPHVQLASLEYIEAVRKRAPGGEQEGWKYHPVEMGRKTALKYACKYVQLTPEVQTLLADEDAQPPAGPSEGAHAKNVRDLWGDAPPVRHRAPRAVPGDAAAPGLPTPSQDPPTLEPLPDQGWRHAVTALLRELPLPQYATFLAETTRDLEDPTTPPGRGGHLLHRCRELVAELHDMSIADEEGIPESHA